MVRKPSPPAGGPITNIMIPDDWDRDDWGDTFQSEARRKVDKYNLESSSYQMAPESLATQSDWNDWIASMEIHKGGDPNV